MERSLKDKGHEKNQPHQIILALYLAAVKFNGLLTIDFLRFNRTASQHRFDEHKFGHGIRSRVDKILKGDSLFKGGPKWAPLSWIVHALRSKENILPLEYCVSYKY